MKKGGIIVMDDHGFAGTPGVKLATDDFVKKNHKNFYFWKLPYGQGCPLLKNKFILRYLELNQIGYIRIFF